jgi:alkanesulfonate monooxygenase SsuD/methylene tetrahydromethanopterin reductase-like flavin-dependent oxidoreductase (luciferase family)
VEFGIFNSLYLPKHLRTHRGAEHERLWDEVEWTVAADRAGFKYSWTTEHHFLDEYSHLSANESFIAFVAARTTQMHHGSGIFNITPPVNHPARVAERAAMLDHLSRGRFELGMGRGSSTLEQSGFGIQDPDLTRDMFDEVVPQLKHMWREEAYSFEGEFFSMPERNVLPKPYTDPHPPLWVAAGSPATFKKAARMGLGVLCFTMSSPESLKPLIAASSRTSRTTPSPWSSRPPEFV